MGSTQHTSQSLDDFCSDQLDQMARHGLSRRLRVVEGPQGARLNMSEGARENFASNDYLGLAAHPLIRQRAQETLKSHGLGSGSSPLISGHLQPMAGLQRALAKWKNTPAALVFTSGYASAMGSLPALFGPRDILILDKLSHACLVDAARMSRATLRVFAHNHMEQLAQRLAWAREVMANRSVADRGHIGVVVEAVYSMDGDVAPLEELIELKERYQAWLMVDEAHAIGAFGQHGSGLLSELGLQDKVEIQMGTLGKALGASGGYIAGSRALIDFLVHRARSFVFSTAPSPVVCGAAQAAIELLQTTEGSLLCQRLHANIRCLRQAIPDSWRVHAGQGNRIGWLYPGSWETPIFPWLCGSAASAVSLSEQLAEQGFLIPAIRYPTVGRNSARLRLSISALHEPETIQALVGYLITNQPSPTQ